MKTKMRKAVFRVKWIMMSERSRYAYLWARSEEN